MRLLMRSFVLSGALLVSLSCATPQPTSPKVDIETNTKVELRETFKPESVITQPDLSNWEEKTSTPYHELESFHDGWLCGLTYSEPVALGQWNLVGISSNRSYTPLLSIVSLRTGQDKKSDTIHYYHFQLSIPGKTGPETSFGHDLE